MLKGSLREPYDFVIDRIVSCARIDTSKEWCRIDLTYEDTWVICLAVGGKCHYDWDGGSCNMTSGDGLLFAPGFTRTARTNVDEPWSFVVLKFHISGENDAARRMLSAMPVYLPRMQKKICDLIRHCDSIWRSRRQTHIIRCKSILLEIMTRLIREAENSAVYGASYKRIEPAMRLLEGGGSYTAEELARAANLSVSHFRALFRQATGYSVVQYRNCMNIAKARDLLLASDSYTIGEVAEMVGIPDIFYFSRLFKQYTGVAPSRIRDI